MDAYIRSHSLTVNRRLADEQKNRLSARVTFCRRPGKLITSVVTGIAHRRPQGESYDQAIRNDATGLWQCPFCQQDNFPELSEVAGLSFDGAEGGAPSRPPSLT